MKNITSLKLLSALMLAAVSVQAAEHRLFEAGVAKIDVTPVEPIRLTGYAVRKTNSVGVEQKLWAKALAIGGGGDPPALLMTLDNCGISEGTYRELARRVFSKFGVEQSRFVICCSHTHSGPCTTGWAPNIFAQDIPAGQQAVIENYTRALIDKLETVAGDALKDRRPAHLSWSRGKVDFASNRRTKDGPVDHDFSLLKATNAEGKLRALVGNYACHCTTLGGEFNKLHGDWAGCAHEAVERDHPGAVALITIGCGADANPHPRGGADGGLARAREHGESIAGEVKRLLATDFAPITESLTSRYFSGELLFGPHFTQEQWETRAKENGIVGYHARKYLARLERGEKLPTKLPYPMVTWVFGNKLAMVFLPGEVVVDYALRLKEELDSSRVWITAYANYVPCYIPSRRILKEGGYEAESSLWYYDRPAQLAPEVEDTIVGTVHKMLPPEYQAIKKKAELPPPKTPAEALGAFRTKSDLRIELAVSEPLIESPVAIDWSADGRLWVCEMYDYPTGLKGNYEPGGRVRVLTDTNGDGTYDRDSLFLDKLPFPTGIMAWGKGVFICAAPDILYAEDTDGDGRADLVRTNFTGFATHNYQARVNGLTLGLDGWIYGSSSLFGVKIRSVATGKSTDLSGRDFRFEPDTLKIEAAAGLSQQGRIRDDFGNWFGNDNSTLLWHYPLPEHYLLRNQHVVYPEPRSNTARLDSVDPNQLFPISRTLDRFNDPQSANRVTSACGPETYRDTLLGHDYYGNAFVCEPVHNLVTRRLLEPDGVTFAARRAEDEENSEFLASTDSWFRPVQARTGPDGALWIVDMYRFVIEHPRWIPPERLRELDVRAGANMGRIYRVVARGTKPRAIPNLARMGDAELASALNTANGPVRDLVHQELLIREGRATQALLAVATNSPIAAARVQGFYVLQQWGGFHQEWLPLATETNIAALAALVPLVTSASTLHKLAKHGDIAVRYHAALALGAYDDEQSLDALAEILMGDRANPWMRAAVLSSVADKPFVSCLAKRPHIESLLRDADLVRQLFQTAFASTNRAVVDDALTAFASRDVALGFVKLDCLLASKISLDDLSSSNARESVARLRELLLSARAYARNSTHSEALRGAAIRVLGKTAKESDDDLRALVCLSTAEPIAGLRQAAIEALRGEDRATVASMLLENWNSKSPTVRTEIISLLLARDAWTSALLSAIQRQEVSPIEVPLPKRAELLKHKDPAIREHAAKALSADSLPSRAAVLAQYRNVASLTANPSGGPDIFEKNCATCHAFRGRGYAVGPNLAEFAAKSVEDFLVAILDPSAAIEPKHVAYTIETKDGRTLMGVVQGETASSVRLVQGGGAIENILRADIADLRALRTSLMPDGLEQNISPQQMADLIAWLKEPGLSR